MARFGAARLGERDRALHSRAMSRDHELPGALKFTGSTTSVCAASRHARAPRHRHRR
jgi:hypothetical protein